MSLPIILSSFLYPINFHILQYLFFFLFPTSGFSQFFLNNIFVSSIFFNSSPWFLVLFFIILQCHFSFLIFVSSSLSLSPFLLFFLSFVLVSFPLFLSPLYFLTFSFYLPHTLLYIFFFLVKFISLLHEYFLFSHPFLISFLFLSFFPFSLFSCKRENLYTRKYQIWYMFIKCNICIISNLLDQNQLSQFLTF